MCVALPLGRGLALQVEFLPNPQIWDTNVRIFDDFGKPNVT